MEIVGTEKKSILKSLFWKALEINPVATGLSIEAAKTIIPMAEQISRRDFLKLAGVGAATTALLNGCFPPISDPKNAPTEVIPHPTFGVDVTKLYPDNNLFLNTEFFGKNIEIREFSTSEIQPYEDQMREAANKMGWDDTNTKLEYDGVAYIDQTGLEVPVIIGFRTPIVDGQEAKYTQMFMYTAFSDKEQSFVPIDQAPTNSQGRFFLISQFEDKANVGTAFFGLTKVIDAEHFEMTVPLFKVITQKNGEKVVTAYEPYSMSPLVIDKPSEAPKGAQKVIASLVSVEIPSESQLPPEITDKYLGQFESTESGVKTINDVETKVIYGIKEDGTKQVIAMEMEINGEIRMTGVSETAVLDKDGNSHNLYVYVDPNWNASDPDDDRSLDKKWGRFNVNIDTANILFGKPEDPKAPLFWNALAQQMGVTTDSAIDTVMNKNEGIINFNVPIGERKKITYNSEMTKLPYPVDLDKPVAIRVVFSQADYERLPQEVKEKRSAITYEQEGEQYGLFDSRLAWTEPNGQLTIYSIYTGYEVFDGLDPLRYGNKGSFLSSEAAKTVSKQIYSIFDLIGDGVQNKVNYYGDSVAKALDADLVKFR